MIRNQWLKTIQEEAPSVATFFQDSDLANYHQHAHHLDHAHMWGKHARILPSTDISAIRSMSFFKKLEAEFGAIEVTDEEEVGREEFYWRLVRPKERGDIGPVHADSWFWELDQRKATMIPDHKERIKVWIAIYCEQGQNGLLIKKGSHLERYPRKGTKVGNTVKPVIQVAEEDLDMDLFQSKPGDAIVFHDNLLHGGALNNGNMTRVSLEFTMIVDRH